MGKFFTQVMVLFLSSLVFGLLLGLLVLLDYTGFYPLHKSFPDTLKQNKTVQEYIKWAEINSLAPKDQKSRILDEKTDYIERLLAQMKLESTRILEEKQRLEFAFRELNDRQAKFDKEKQLFEDRVKQMEEQRALEYSEGLKVRLDKLAQTFAKLDPQKASEILIRNGAAMSFEIMNRLKPKTLGNILAEMDQSARADFVKVLQRWAPPAKNHTVPEVEEEV